MRSLSLCGRRAISTCFRWVIGTSVWARIQVSGGRFEPSSGPATRSLGVIEASSWSEDSGDDDDTGEWVSFWRWGYYPGKRQGSQTTT